ncbi:hypothetical protein C7Y72_18145 [Paraconexibacter algicola]|uniref:SAP domain-containing protein n=2 Tax=Paraconexibacter algicola TaxID=2133960 RepID=A0A2T4UDI5_9ACTN|nr:hypothetical protein C7Y72_18145 [Paraconexibacter algicola]
MSGDDANSAETARRAAAAALSGLFEQEIQIVAPLDPTVTIETAEREREIAKAALGGLKVDELARLSADLGIRNRGSRAELVNRLVAFLGTNEQELAELIVRYADPDSSARRLTSRLIPVGESLDAAEWAARLADYEQTYFRTGIAEWFIVRDADTHGPDFSIDGSLLSYEVEAEPLQAAARGAYGFRTDQRQQDVVIWVRNGEPTLRIHARGEHESRAAGRAVQFAARVGPAEKLFPVSRPDLTDARLAPATTWLLQVVRAAVLHPRVLVGNVGAVTFERERSSAAHVGAETPQIESSRFKGRHVLDTPQIARYLTTGQVLSAIAFSCIVVDNGQEFELPCRIAIENKSVLVATGLGRTSPDVAATLHRELEDLVANAIEAPALNVAETHDLLGKLLDRRLLADAPAIADLFARPGASGAAQVAMVTT